MEEEEIQSPTSLYYQCLEIIVKYPDEALLCHNAENYMEVDIDETDRVLSTEKYISIFELRTPAFLPETLCEPLFQKIIRQHSEQYLQVFINTSLCRLTKINLSDSHTKDTLQDQQLISKLFQHPLRDINLSSCKLLPSTLGALRYCSKTLKVLDLSYVTGLKRFLALKELKNLVKLNLQHTDIGYQKEHMRYIGNLPKLVWLDLSNTSVDDTCLADLESLGRTLSWLSLYQCVHITDEEELIKLLLKLENLAYLDISKNPFEQENEGDKIAFPIVNRRIVETLSTLKNLSSLDISGTSTLKIEDLAPLSNRPKELKFLGLCNAAALCYKSTLPAETVTGEANEEQILTSLELYHDRIKFVSISLRKLFSLASHHGCLQIERCIRLILRCMSTYKKNNGIHIAATASLYHLSREDDPANSIAELRRAIILVILESMENLEGVLQLQKNSCLTLCNFKIPVEVDFQYFRIAELLLTALRNHQDDYLRRIAIMLFNAIVCQNAGSQKKEIGLRGAIETIIQVLREKIESSQPDQLMETCWSSLWNITDETPENCCDFLQHGGMDLFVGFLNLYPEALELQRNMMGLMGNVAEVKDLRPHLMRDQYLDHFIHLLRDEPQWLEVSYNSAGILSHVLSDGTSAWKVRSITRDDCMEKIIACIESWDIKSLRNINYRSFKPILHLLGCFNAPAAQHWSAWALANLTKVYPFKYCKLVEDEGGLEILQLVLEAPYVSIRIKELSRMVIEHCNHELCFR